MMLTQVEYEPVIGLEVHVELATESKMFCACPVVDSTSEQPNIAVCPVCCGMPGVLPVINQRAIEYGLPRGTSIAVRDPFSEHLRSEELLLPRPSQGISNLPIRKTPGSQWTIDYFDLYG